ncbi:MAG: monofunctional biosynthetic peptidoglycan transglycosylase [Xanthobacteraceae bacterium]
MRRAVRIIVVLCLLVLAMPYVLTLAYSTGHPVSTLMIGRWFTGQPVMREWRDLTEIAPALARAVIAAEDARFCSHRGIDWGSLQEAIEDAQEGDSGGGGSTITQQTAKNLFLWPGRSFIRKGLEIPLAMWVDFVLPKRRILEIYLNIAEMGPSGQFGAEAAAQYAFGRPARALSPHEAGLLAAILPNPVRRSAKNPGPGVRRLAARYVGRARSAPEIFSCLR